MSARPHETQIKTVPSSAQAAPLREEKKKIPPNTHALPKKAGREQRWQLKSGPQKKKKKIGLADFRPVPGFTSPTWPQRSGTDPARDHVLQDPSAGSDRSTEAEHTHTKHKTIDFLH